MISKKAGAGLVLSACSLLVYTGSWAEPGLQATLDVSQRVENVEESGIANPRYEGLQSVTGLDLLLSSETRTQRLVFGASTDLRWSSEGTDEFSRDNPALRFGYGLEGKQSALDVAASFRRTDVYRDIFIEDPIEDPIDLINDTGTVDQLSLQSSLTLGREGPVSLVLNHRYLDRSYSGTTDPDLRDSTTQDVSARASVALSPVASVGLFASYRDFSQDGVGGNNRTESSFGIDGQYQVSKVTAVTAGVSQQNIESNTTATQDGLGLSFGVQHQRPNGELGGTLSRDQSVNGERTEVSLNRSYVLTRGQLSGSLGLSRTGDLDVQPIASARLRYDLAELSQLTMSLSQQVATSADNTETLLTRFSVGLNQELTSQSSLSANLQFVSRNELSGSGNDQSSVRADLTYRHALTDDWDLLSGYEHTFNQNDARADRTTSTVFLGLARSFSFRP